MTLIKTNKNWPQFLQYWMIYSPCCSLSIHWSFLLPPLFVPPAVCCNWSVAFFLTEMLQVVGGSVYKEPGAINALHRHPPGQGSHQPSLLGRWSDSKHHHTHWICQRNQCFFSWLGFERGIFLGGAAPPHQETKKQKHPGQLGEGAHPPAWRWKTGPCCLLAHRKEAGQGPDLRVCSTRQWASGVRDGGSEKVGHKLGGV